MRCPIRGVTGETIRNRHWENYLQSVSYTVPCFYRPSSFESLPSLIRAAEANGKKLRVCGSGWSFEDICHSDDMMVDISLLNNRLTNVTATNGVLHDNHVYRIAAGPAKGQYFERGTVVHVEAGIKLFDLNQMLDSLHLALPTMGGSQGQTLAGAFSTSTHGSDFGHGPLSDHVVAVHLVTSGGRSLWIESTERPATRNDEALRPVLPAGTEIIRDDEALNAVTVGLGRFGIIYSVMLEVMAEHELQQWTSSRPITNVLGLLRAGAGTADPLGPLRNALMSGPGPAWATDPDRDHFLKFIDITMSSRPSEDCWVRRRWVRFGTTRNPVASHNPDWPDPSAWARLPAMAPIIIGSTMTALGLSAAAVSALLVPNAITAATTAIALTPDPFDDLAIPFIAIAIAAAGGPVATIWSSNIAAQATAFAARAIDGHSRFAGDAVAEAINTLVNAAAGLPAPFDGLNDFVFEQMQIGRAIDTITRDLLSGGIPVTSAETPNGLVGRNWNICAGASAGSGAPHFRVNSMEIVFSMANAGFVDFIEFLRSQCQNFVQTGYFAIRFTKSARALLSMHNVGGGMAVSIEIVSMRGVRDNDTWFRLIHERAVSMGGRPHWGQQNSLGAADTARLYRDNLTRWKEQLVRIAGASPAFSNNYTRQRGLEPGGRTRLVTHVRRSGGRITHLVNLSTRWREVPIDDAIRQISENTVSYIVFSESRLLTLSVKRILRTVVNDRRDDDLDRLPELPMPVGIPAFLSPFIAIPPPPTLRERQVTAISRAPGSRPIRFLHNQTANWTVPVEQAFEEIQANRFQYFVSPKPGLRTYLEAAIFLSTRSDDQDDAVINALPSAP